jgi:cell division protein FtsB
MRSKILQTEESFLHEIDQKVQEKSRKMYLGDWNLRKLVVVLSLLTFLIYQLYNILLGKNSFYVVEQLEDEKKELIKEIRELKKENEKLQKHYFNLKLTREEEDEY